MTDKQAVQATTRRVGSPVVRAEMVRMLRSGRRMARRMGFVMRLRPGGVAMMIRAMEQTYGR